MERGKGVKYGIPSRNYHVLLNLAKMEAEKMGAATS